MQNKGSIPGRRFFKVQQKMGISDEELVRRQRAFFAKGAPCFIKAGLWNARALEPKLLGERRDAFLRTLDDEAEAWQEKRREEAEKRQQERAERARLRDMRTPYSMRLEACQRFDEEEEERREEEEAARRAEAGEDEQMEDEQEEQVVDEEQRRLDEEQRKLYRLENMQCWKDLTVPVEQCKEVSITRILVIIIRMCYIDCVKTGLAAAQTLLWNNKETF